MAKRGCTLDILQLHGAREGVPSGGSEGMGETRLMAANDELRFSRDLERGS